MFAEIVKAFGLQVINLDTLMDVDKDKSLE
jgi:hypothetical protein